MRKPCSTSRALVAEDKGLLAMDESNPTCNKRFTAPGIPQTEEARRAYRELIVTTPGVTKSISGAILYDETIRQQTKGATPFVKVLTDAGIIPGIKVDGGAKDMAGHHHQSANHPPRGQTPSAVSDFGDISQQNIAAHADSAIHCGHLLVAPARGSLGFRAGLVGVGVL